jgi:hypothetical protein
MTAEPVNLPYLYGRTRNLSVGSPTLHWLTPVYMAISSCDITVLKQTMIHWICSDTGFPILAETQGDIAVEVLL